MRFAMRDADADSTKRAPPIGSFTRFAFSHAPSTSALPSNATWMIASSIPIARRPRANCCSIACAHRRAAR
jgi:hypothetical protein